MRSIHGVVLSEHTGPLVCILREGRLILSVVPCDPPFAKRPVGSPVDPEALLGAIPGAVASFTFAEASRSAAFRIAAQVYVLSARVGEELECSLRVRSPAGKPHCSRAPCELYAKHAADTDDPRDPHVLRADSQFERRARQGNPPGLVLAFSKLLCECSARVSPPRGQNDGCGFRLSHLVLCLSFCHVRPQYLVSAGGDRPVFRLITEGALWRRAPHADSVHPGNSGAGTPT